MKKILLVDGHNLLFQMFYGMPNKIFNDKKEDIRGVIGFIGALIKIIKINNPDYCLILFDGEHPLKRQEINKDYKMNRKNYNEIPKEDNPFSQYSMICKVLEVMNIRFIEILELEADDIIASYCFKYGQDYKIIISSFDTDFYSLIDQNINVFRYRTESSKLIDKTYIQNKYFIDSKYFADYKALIGDSADNIKGLKGIGPKTASQLINTYGSVSKIIKSVDQIKPERIKNIVLNNIDRLTENISLIKFSQQYSLPFLLEELAYSLKENAKTLELIRKAEQIDKI